MSKVVTLSEAASIALHSMILVGRSKKSINVDNIAEATGSSRHHIAKIMQRLAKLGYVGSMRRPSGGFFLLQKQMKFHCSIFMKQLKVKLCQLLVL
jgi:DNA-binding IscR family transcriptional regulator